MADKHSLNYDVRELKLGASFTNNKTSQYHTIKYDFKPASVDVNKMATVDVGTNNQVTVTVPHLDGAGVPQTVFKGSQRPYTKECVLIIDRVTGEITLEKLSSNIQVKKTRQESNAKPRPLTPVASELTNTTQRSTSRTRVATNRRTHAAGTAPYYIRPPFNHSPLRVKPHEPAPAAPVSGPARAGAGAGAGAGAHAHNTPPNMVRSPQRFKTSPPQAAPWSGGGNSTLASLPMIGLDDLAGPAPAPAPAANGFPAAPARALYPAPDHRPPEHRPPDHRPQEHRAPEHRPQEHRAPDHRPMDHRAPDHRPVDHRAPDHRPVDHRAPDHRPVDHRAPDHRPVDHRAPDHRPVDHRAPDHRPVDHRAPDHRPVDHRAPDHRPVDYRAPEHRPPNPQINVHPPQDDSSSSSSSDSDSDSGSDSDDAAAPANGGSAQPALPRDVLNDDLCLSESGSDSD